MPKKKLIIIAAIAALFLLVAIVLLLTRGKSPGGDEPDNSPTLSDNITPEPSDSGFVVEPPANSPAADDVDYSQLVDDYVPASDGGDCDIDDSINDYEPSDYWWMETPTSKEPVIPTLTVEDKNKLIFKSVDENIPGAWEATSDGITTTYEFKKDGTYTMTYTDAGGSPLPQNESGTYEVTHTTIEDDYPHALVFTPSGQTQTRTVRFLCYNNKAQTEYHFVLEGSPLAFSRK